MKYLNNFKKKLLPYYSYLPLILTIFIIIVIILFGIFINNFDFKNKKDFVMWYFNSHYLIELIFFIIILIIFFILKYTCKYTNKEFQILCIRLIVALILSTVSVQLHTVLFLLSSDLPPSILYLKNQLLLEQHIGYYSYFYNFIFKINDTAFLKHHFVPRSHIWNRSEHTYYTYFWLFLGFNTIQIFCILLNLLLAHRFSLIGQNLYKNKPININLLNKNINFTLFYFFNKIIIFLIFSAFVLC